MNMEPFSANRLQGARNERLYEALGPAIRILACSSGELTERLRAAGSALGGVSRHEITDETDRRTLDRTRLTLMRCDLAEQQSEQPLDFEPSDQLLEEAAQDMLDLRARAMLRAISDREGRPRTSTPPRSAAISNWVALDETIRRLAVSTRGLEQRLERASVPLAKLRKANLETEAETALRARIEMGVKRMHRQRKQTAGQKPGEVIPEVALEATASHIVDLYEIVAERALRLRADKRRGTRH